MQYPSFSSFKRKKNNILLDGRKIHYSEQWDILQENYKMNLTTIQRKPLFLLHFIIQQVPHA